MNFVLVNFGPHGGRNEASFSQYETQEQAVTDLSQRLTSGDEYQIVHFPERVGSGTIVSEGIWKAE